MRSAGVMSIAGSLSQDAGNREQGTGDGARGGSGGIFGDLLDSIGLCLPNLEDWRLVTLRIDENYRKSDFLGFGTQPALRSVGRACG